jgi:hypothetical protein
MFLCGEIKEGGYLALEYNDYGKYVNKNSLIKFDDNKKEVWRYSYNTNGDKSIFRSYHFGKGRKPHLRNPEKGK